MKNPTASSGVSFNGKSFMGVAPPNPCLPFITAASGAVFWLFPHKAYLFPAEWNLLV
jgi:hypothetical protein